MSYPEQNREFTSQSVNTNQEWALHLCYHNNPCGYGKEVIAVLAHNCRDKNVSLGINFIGCFSINPINPTSVTYLPWICTREKTTIATNSSICYSSNDCYNSFLDNLFPWFYHITIGDIWNSTTFRQHF